VRNIDSEVAVLDDGSVLLLPPDTHEHERPTGPADGTLSVADVPGFVVDAVASGITFDVIKAAVRDLVARHRLAEPAVATADQVRDVITSYLLASGYLDVAVVEIRHLPQQGWTVQARADDESFRAWSDESGQLIHLRAVFGG